MDPHVGVLEGKPPRVVSVGDGDVERAGHPVGEPGEVQCASVREHALPPPVGDGGELVVEHLRQAVDTPRELVYGARFQGMGDGTGQETRFGDLRRASHAAGVPDQPGDFLASPHCPSFLIYRHKLYRYCV